MDSLHFPTHLLSFRVSRRLKSYFLRFFLSFWVWRLLWLAWIRCIRFLFFRVARDDERIWLALIRSIRFLLSRIVRVGRLFWLAQIRGIRVVLLCFFSVPVWRLFWLAQIRSVRVVLLCFLSVPVWRLFWLAWIRDIPFLLFHMVRDQERFWLALIRCLEGWRRKRVWKSALRGVNEAERYICVHVISMARLHSAERRKCRRVLQSWNGRGDRGGVWEQ